MPTLLKCTNIMLMLPYDYSNIIFVVASMRYLCRYSSLLQHNNNIMAESASAAPKSAAPRRGKFLAGPSQLPSEGSSSSSSSSSGGQQLSSTGTANTGGNDDVFHDHSMEDLRAHVHNIKTIATARRKVIESQRKLVLDNLDKAEDVLLALLELASGVTNALSDMTTASTTKTRRQGSSESTKNGKCREEEEEEDNARQLGGKSFEELATRVSAGSSGYSSGVKKLHSFLAPHAHYVKSLTNNNRLTSTATDKSGERSTSNNYGSLMAATSSSGTVFGKIIEEATSNMYAVRVKKRLVMERCEVLRQMIQLEEDDGALSETGQVKVEEEQDDKPKKKVSAAASSKRKRR